MKKPTNTTKQVHENPGSFLAESFLFGSHAIERQEVRGQREAVNSDTLPADGSNNQAWERMGIVYGDAVDGDPIFRYVTMPTGWTKRATGHSMHNEVVDDKGRVRARFFYKAAFYDRSANIHPERRFDPTYEPEGGWDAPYSEGQRCFAVVKDGGREIWRSAEPFAANGPKPTTPEEWNTYKLASDVARGVATSHLVEIGFPNWNDAAAYWD